jgi:serine phosphatase RsbU (regulator of sigma subunit)
MNFSFRTVVAFWVSMILYLTLISAGVFFLRIYSNEKIASAYESQLSSTAQFTSSLESTLLSLPQLPVSKIKTSNEMVFVEESPCTNPAGETLTSSSFNRLVTESKFSIRTVVTSRAVYEACLSMQQNHKQYVFLKNDQKFPIPYLLLLAEGPPQRLAMISMDSLAGTSSIGLAGIVSKEGLLWKSLDSDDYDQFRQKHVEVLTQILEAGRKTSASNLSSLAEVSDGFFASISPFLGEMSAFSLSSKSQILSTVSDIAMQIVWLMLGASCLIILLARKIVSRLSRPLTELSHAADRIGAGDLTTKIDLRGDAEFRTLQSTFNHMASELKRLIDVAKESSKLESELELAKKVQEVLFPPSKLQVGKYRLSSFVQNADRCGGDWWSFVEAKTKEGSTKLILMIGDVTGHGAPSALVTAAAQGAKAVIERWVSEDPSMVNDPRHLLQLFNRAVHASSGGALSMSFLVCVIDELNNTLSISNAGHNWPYLISKDEAGVFSIKAVGAASEVLGNDPNQEFPHLETHPWTPDSKLVLYTDGLIDCFQGEKNLYDKRAFIRSLKANLSRASDAILGNVMHDRKKAIEQLHAADDVTFVICSQEIGK